jgi:hypothetical protein
MGFGFKACLKKIQLSESLEYIIGAVFINKKIRNRLP